MFQIVKWNHKEEKGIYKVSEKVSRYSRIKDIAEPMVKWLDENNGKFPLPYTTAYAVSHCQVEADPWAFFVLGYEFMVSNKPNRSKKDTTKNFYFPSQIIVNARILEAPEKLSVNKPVRKLVKKGGKIVPEISIVPSEEKNLIGVPEACMSFLHRTQRTTERYYRIKVRYQYPRKILGMWFLWTKTEWVEGLKSHIFQHEIDHAEAKNMYFKN